MVRQACRRSVESNLHVHPSNLASERDYCRRAGSAQGSGGENLFRGRDQPAGASVYFANARERDRLSRQGIRLVVEVENNRRVAAVAGLEGLIFRPPGATLED